MQDKCCLQLALNLGLAISLRKSELFKGVIKINSNQEKGKSLFGALLKIAGLYILYFMMLIVISVAIFIILAVMGKDPQTIFNSIINGEDMVGNMYTFAVSIIDCLGLILAVTLFCNKVDHRPLKDIGFISVKKGYRDLIQGLIFGAVCMIAIFIILLVTKNISLENSILKPDFNISMLSGLVIFIFVGINEEMFARGYCVTVLSEASSKKAAAIISAIIFALMHYANNSMSALSYMNLFLFGLLAAYMFIKSQNLWMGIGCHITWNYFEGSVFGFQVSGQGIESMYNVSANNNIITGGNFGPEGGLVVTLILILGFIYIWKVYKPQISSTKNN